jgi:hypothetical protein
VVARTTDMQQLYPLQLNLSYRPWRRDPSSYEAAAVESY